MKDGEPLMSFGVMGGDMQAQGQAQVVSNIVDFDLGLQEAGDTAEHHEGGRADRRGSTRWACSTWRAACRTWA